MVNTNTNFATYFDAVTLAGGYKDILFVNQGTSTANINGLLLLAGDTLSDNSSDSNEVNNTTYEINFLAGGINNLLVITKEYA